MRLLSFIFIFVSSSALACPDLSGTYASCRSLTSSDSTSSDVVVSQRLVNGQTVYTVTASDDETAERSTENLQADGKVVVTKMTDPESGMEFDLYTLMACEGTNSLYIASRIIFQEQTLGTIVTNIKKEGSSLRMTSKGKAMDQEINEESICE